MLFLIPVIAGIQSCTEKQDFDQYNDLTITPTAETSVFFVRTAAALIANASEAVFFSEDFNFNAFEDEFFSEQVLDGVLVYELENTTIYPVQFTLQFLDASDTVLDTETLAMEAAPAAVVQREVAYGNAGKSLDILRNTSKIRIIATTTQDTPITTSGEDSAVILRSSAQFRLEVK